MSFEVLYDGQGNVKSPPPTGDVVQEPLVPVEEPVYEDYVEELPEEAQAAPEMKPAEKSWAELRRKADSAERERDELRRQLEEANRRTYIPPQPEEDLSYTINDDDLVEGRQLSKVDKKIRRLEQQLAEQQAFNNQRAIEAKLKSDYPDFEAVVSVDNVNKLQREYPEIFRTLQSAQDMHAQAVSAYTMIKKLGIVPDDDFSSLNRIRANTAKPRTAAGIQSQKGDSPLSKANPFSEGLTEDLKAQLWKDMQSAIRNK